MTHVPSGAGSVMASRKDHNDHIQDFPTQPWGTRALIEHVLLPRGLIVPSDHCWEPACNRGYMVRPLREFFPRVYASDAFDYRDKVGGNVQEHQIDFLENKSEQVATERPVQWVITNPPFELAEDFIERARQIATVGFALLVRTSFLEGEERYRTIFKTEPPQIIAIFSERLPMVQGRCLKREPDPNRPGRLKTVSTATSYAWLVWRSSLLGTTFQWIPPCRARLERDGDYLEQARVIKEVERERFRIEAGV